MDDKTATLSQSNQEFVREELRRLFASAHFSSSHRCQTLLGYVVENALNGDMDSLKERSIGIAVFGRDPSYDTNSDPVVRSAAGEVRKRLAQCYYDSADQPKLRIELPIGSYVPVFSLSDTSVHQADNSAPMAPGKPGNDSGIDSTATGSVAIHPSRYATWWLAAGILAVLVCASFLYLKLHTKSQDAFELFWAPVVKSHQAVLICIGDMQLPPIHPLPGAASHEPAFALAMAGSGDNQYNWPVMPVQDSITLMNLVLLLRTENKAFAIRGQEATSFDDLQKGPVILLGANNAWAIRLLQPMRFHLMLDQNSLRRGIVDEQKPGTEIGAVKAFVSASNSEDYVVIARTFEPHTQQPTIVVAGVTPAATHAAGEFLTNPVYLNDFGKKAPNNWQTKNMEILLVTNNVNGDSGPPRVVDSYFW